MQLQFVALHKVVGVRVVCSDPRHTPVIGTPIFEFGLAFLDARFLNLEFG